MINLFKTSILPIKLPKFQLGFFSEHQMAAEWQMTLKFKVII